MQGNSTQLGDDQNATAGTQNIVYGNQYIAGRDQYIITIVLPDGRKVERLFVGVPRPPEVFVGRSALVADLKARLLTGSSLAISALKGLPGVGKTALAAVLASDAALLDHFSGGVLWAGLGKEPDQLALLGRWGTALGLSDGEIGRLTTIESRAQAIHDRIGQAKMLLVVDDAWDSQQALNFRLGGPNCAHLLTTRIPEVALHFTAKGLVEVAELSTEDGILLLTELAPKAVEVELEEARRLVEEVGGLPLAIVLMGGYLRTRSHSGQTRRIKEAIAYLTDEVARLKQSMPQSPIERHPSLSDTPLSLLATIKLSDDTLKDSERKGIRALAVFAPKPNDFTEEAALWVTHGPTESLDLLTESGMLEVAGNARYTLHQTIAEYMVASIKGEIEPATPSLDLDDLRRKHASYYVSFMMHHSEDWRAIERTWGQVSYGWRHYVGIRAERDDLVLLYVKYAIGYMLKRGMWRELVAWNEQALLAARRAELPDMEAHALGNLAVIYTEQGELERALDYAEQARQAAVRSGDRYVMTMVASSIARAYAANGRPDLAEPLYAFSLTGHTPQAKATIIGNMAGLRLLEGDRAEAISGYNIARERARELGDTGTEALALIGLGNTAAEFGDYTPALSYYQQALPLLREAGELVGEADCLNNIGVCLREMSDLASAEAYYNRALVMCRELNDRLGIAKCLANLAQLYADTGRTAAAIANFQAALEVFRASHHRGEGEVLGNLGHLYLDQGDTAAALTHMQAALNIAREKKNPLDEAWLLNGLGRALQQQGNSEAAMERYREGLEIAERLNLAAMKANILISMGLACHFSDPRTALGYYEQAARISRQAGDKKGLGDALNNIGGAYEALGDFASAISNYQQSLSLRREIGAVDDTITTIGHLCRTYEAAGDLGAAVPYYLEAATLFAEQGKDDTQAQLICLAANNLMKLGEFGPALAQYQIALPLAHKADIPQLEASILSNIAAALAESGGDERRVVDYLDQAAEAFHRLENPDGEANVRHNLSALYVNAGRWREAAAALEQVAELREKVGDFEQEVKDLELLAEICFDKLRDNQGATRAMVGAARCFDKLGRQQDRGEVLLGIAGLLSGMGDNDAATPYQEEAVAALKAAGHLNLAVETMSNLAEKYAAQGRFAEARATCEESLSICQMMGITIGEATNLLLLATIRARQGDLKGGLAAAEQALAVGRRMGNSEMIQVAELTMRRIRNLG